MTFVRFTFVTVLEFGEVRLKFRFKKIYTFLPILDLFDYLVL